MLACECLRVCFLSISSCIVILLCSGQSHLTGLCLSFLWIRDHQLEYITSCEKGVLDDPSYFKLSLDKVHLEATGSDQEQSLNDSPPFDAGEGRFSSWRTVVSIVSTI